jgi:exopolyphosphatase/guanosine-5'-triphosphate,3'-diphosphate pyrophosphatase
MRVAVVDVGSNTARLLVAEHDQGRLQPIREARRLVLLGRDIEERGECSAKKLAELGDSARRFASLARKHGAERVEVVVTAPGRQAANATEILRVLREATAVSTRVLSAEEEGRLAWRGVVASEPDLAESVAVCDVGGGSTEVVVGTPDGGPVWSRSVDIGSLRLARRVLADVPPGDDAMRAAEREAASAFSGLAFPIPQKAFACGGTARALRKLAGETLGPEELALVLRFLERSDVRRIAKSARVSRRRAETLPAGAVILAELQKRLAVPFCVSRAGLREGIALELVPAAAAA